MSTIKVSSASFVAFLQARCAAKDGYLMGGVGQYAKNLTKGSYLINQYKDNSKQYAQALYWLANAERVWDCNGLIEGYYNDTTGENINTKARYNYSGWCSVKGTGTIPVDYRVPGAAVFIHDNGYGYITHVGFLEKPVTEGKPGGDWYVIEARGVMYGVVRTKMSARGWNRWGLMDKYVDYAGVEEYELELGARTLRKGMYGSDVNQLQGSLITLGYSCGKYGADGDFGDSTELAVKAFQKDEKLTVDGEYGTKSHAALMARFTESPDPDTSETTQPDTTSRPTLRRGDKGADVKTLQYLLIAKGYALPKYGADGDFGAETESAVKVFQKARGLEVDGIVGALTWGALLTDSVAAPTYRVIISGLTQTPAHNLTGEMQNAGYVARMEAE